MHVHNLLPTIPAIMYEIYKDTECDVKVIHSSWAGKEVHTINNIKKEVNDIYKVHADG